MCALGGSDHPLSGTPKGLRPTRWTKYFCGRTDARVAAFDLRPDATLDSFLESAAPFNAVRDIAR